MTDNSFFISSWFIFDGDVEVEGIRSYILLDFKRFFDYREIESEVFVRSVFGIDFVIFREFDSYFVRRKLFLRRSFVRLLTRKIVFLFDVIDFR